MTIQQAFQLASDHYSAGRLDSAEVLCQEILKQDEAHADSLHLLGLIAHRTGRRPIAEDLLRRAIGARPNEARFYFSLANTLLAGGRFDLAIHCLGEAVRLRPDFAEAHNNLGLCLLRTNRLPEAIPAFRRALEIKPDFAFAHNNLGNALKDAGEANAAISAYRAAIRLQPDLVEAYSNLGVVLHATGLSEEAIDAYEAGLRLKPQQALAQNNLGLVHLDEGRIDQAVTCFAAALKINPQFAEAWNNLANAYRELGRMDAVIEAYQNALQLNPNLAATYSNLGAALRDTGRVAHAVEHFRRAVALQPANSALRSNLVYALHFVPDATDEAIAEERRRWDQHFGGRKAERIDTHSNDRNPERRLRIGYMSADFREHVVGRNLLPLLRQQNRTAFEILCYSGVVIPDAITEQFRCAADGWCNTVGVSDGDLAEIIGQHQVDILVDLGQHLAGNRLPVFARRPAPVQFSFGGYPESTGVEAIDFRITDRWLESEGRFRTSKIEEGRFGKSVSPIVDRRIPNSDSELAPSLSKGTAGQAFLIDSFWCYDPRDADIAVNGLPVKGSGRITFGSLNNFCKINDLVLQLWARVMTSVPNARLILLSAFGSHRQRTLDFLAEHGVETGRVEFLTPCPHQEYLELYHHLDIALDPFPYGGHTTSLDALWMGVPVVSLAGERSVSRAGLSILSNLGLPELVTFSEDEYVEITARLANDIPRLEELRRTLRPRMEKSVLMDGPHFARQIEATYRAAWREWCEEKHS